MGSAGHGRLSVGVHSPLLVSRPAQVFFHTSHLPPQPHLSAAVEFDHAMQDALEAILGGPMLDWSWLKASLPSSRGGLNLHSASLHAPAAFLASWSRSLQLMQSILGQPLGPFSHTSSTLAALTVAATRPEWPSLDAIDVPLHQRLLSHAINKAIHHHILSTTPNTCSRALALSFRLPHAGDWLNVVP